MGNEEMTGKQWRMTRMMTRYDNALRSMSRDAIFMKEIGDDGGAMNDTNFRKDSGVAIGC